MSWGYISSLAWLLACAMMLISKQDFESQWPLMYRLESSRNTKQSGKAGFALLVRLCSRQQCIPSDSMLDFLCSQIAATNSTTFLPDDHRFSGEGQPYLMDLMSSDRLLICFSSVVIT